MKVIGLLLVALALLGPLGWFLPLTGKHDALAVLSQYIGSAALIAMGLSQLLATRMRWLETIFGGLDRIYVLHKWLGIGAVAAVLLHDTMDADIDGLGQETWLTDLAETLGEFSLYTLLVLVVITIATFIPYHLWRWTHKAMGAVFALSAFHYIFMIKPFSLWDPLGLYVLGFCVLGIVCYLVTLLPFGAFDGRHAYVVSEVASSGDALAVSLEPQQGGLSHRAGQFSFVRFALDGLDEVHPFTISSAPRPGGRLSFTIKPLGDYTSGLARKLAPGVGAQLSPAHGRFWRRRGGEPQIWIAGGIGVTPFAAFAGELDESDGPVHFFYCVRERAAAAHLSLFKELDEHRPGFHLHLIETGRQGRLTAAQIEAAIDVPLSRARVWFCGPEPMRENLKASLAARGLPSRRFAYEEFEIRSGIGLRRLLGWLMELARPGR